MHKIDGKTRVYGLLGCPVRHTLSPHMYNPLFEHLGINAVYVPFEVQPEYIGRAITGMRALGLQGVHLTTPHKEAVLPYLDRLSREAAAIGAVNVVLNNRGQLYGDNTDGRGYLRSLQRELQFEASGKAVVILGAGGSARAIAMTLARVGVARIHVLNRTLSRAERLSEDLKVHHPEINAQALPLDSDAFSRVAGDAHLVVDCTVPASDNPVDGLDVSGLPSHAIVSDINYHRQGAPLLKAAQARNLTVHRGLGMLVHQGAISMTLLIGLTVKPEQLEAFLVGRHPLLEGLTPEGLLPDPSVSAPGVLVG